MVGLIINTGSSFSDRMSLLGTQRTHMILVLGILDFLGPYTSSPQVGPRRGKAILFYWIQITTAYESTFQGISSPPLFYFSNFQFAEMNRRKPKICSHGPYPM